MGNEHVDRVLELCNQVLQRPADVAYPTENGTDVDEQCWRCTAAAADTELGLCGSCDGELRSEEPPVEADQRLGMAPGVRSDLWAAFWEGFNRAAEVDLSTAFRQEWAPRWEASHLCWRCGGPLRFCAWAYWESAPTDARPVFECDGCGARHYSWGGCCEISPVEVGGVQRLEERDETVRGGGADGGRRAGVDGGSSG